MNTDTRVHCIRVTESLKTTTQPYIGAPIYHTHVVHSRTASVLNRLSLSLNQGTSLSREDNLENTRQKTHGKL